MKIKSSQGKNKMRLIFKRTIFIENQEGPNFKDQQNQVMEKPLGKKQERHKRKKKS